MASAWYVGCNSPCTSVCLRYVCCRSDTAKMAGFLRGCGAEKRKTRPNSTELNRRVIRGQCNKKALKSQGFQGFLSAISTKLKRTWPNLSWCRLSDTRNGLKIGLCGFFVPFLCPVSEKPEHVGFFPSPANALWKPAVCLHSMHGGDADAAVVCNLFQAPCFRSGLG